MQFSRLRFLLPRSFSAALVTTVALAASAGAEPARNPEAPVFQLALAKTATPFEELYSYYFETGFRPIWIGSEDENIRRRQAFLSALGSSSIHGIPLGNARKRRIEDLLSGVDDLQSAAAAEVEISSEFVQFARELNSGFLDPQDVDKNIVPSREILATDFLLNGISEKDPEVFISSLAPGSADYANLLMLHEKYRSLAASGGWGPKVEAEGLKWGASGPDVVALRNRLIRMGYLPRIAETTYGQAITLAVRRFQLDHGLEADGLAGPLTIKAVNVEPIERLGQVIASLERARWMNKPLGERHIYVNLANFRAEVMDNGRPVFESRVVVGQNTTRLRTPEFSDVMTHMTVNPVWYVPRSIAVGEVLPQLKQDPSAEAALEIFDPETGTVDRAEIDFNAYNASDFPFRMRQPPGPTNALGAVKFMFPNKYNIYMHDTPEKKLFESDVRAYSHGCIRVHRAFDFARMLLSEQMSPSFDFFENLIQSRTEVHVNFDEPLPVHVTYRTAWVTPDGRTNFRADIYNRDKAIYNALLASGLDSGFPSS